MRIAGDIAIHRALLTTFSRGLADGLERKLGKTDQRPSFITASSFPSAEMSYSPLFQQIEKSTETRENLRITSEMKRLGLLVRQAVTIDLHEAPYSWSYDQ